MEDDDIVAAAEDLIRGHVEGQHIASEYGPVLWLRCPTCDASTADLVGFAPHSCVACGTLLDAVRDLYRGPMESSPCPSCGAINDIARGASRALCGTCDLDYPWPRSEGGEI